YVLMPDHLHAFVALDAERVNLSALMMKSLKNGAVEEIRRTWRRPAALAERIFRPRVAQSGIGWGEVEIRQGKSGARRACGVFQRVEISRRNICSGLSRGTFVMCALAFCSGAL